MSITPMKKVGIWAHKSDAEALSGILLRLRCLDLDKSPVTEDFSGRPDESEARRIHEKNIQSVEFAMKALAPYCTGRVKKRGKKKLDQDRFESSGRASLTLDAVNRVCEACARREEIDKSVDSLIADKRTAEIWSGYDLPLGFRGTDEVSAVLGTVPSFVSDGDIEDAVSGLDCAFSEIGRDSASRYMSFFCIKSEETAVIRRLSPKGFVKTEFDEETGSASSLISGYSGQLGRLYAENDSLGKLLSEYANLMEDIESLYDCEKTHLREAELRESLASTDDCVYLTGWIPEDSVGKTEKRLSDFSCAFDFSDPTEDDNVPVKLKNNFFARNFEWVVSMYSLPKYGTYDPTFIMSLWYVVLFAAMFADAGYGLLMALVGFIAPKVLKTDESLTRAMNMFAWCGVVTFFMGFALGGIFGDLPLVILKRINPAKFGDVKTLALFVDPVQDSTGFMIAGLVLGVLHLVTAQAVKFALVWKHESKIGAICDYAFYWIIYAGIGIAIAVNMKIGVITAVSGAVLVVLTAGRREKGIFKKLVKGLLGLYGLINFGSDVLSYLRILAITLSGSVLASVFNQLAFMSDSLVFRIIGLPLILLVGHIMNLVLSALSAFIHTSRLQYVEFFGKFYVDGGRPYAPMLPSGRYSEIN